MYNALIADNCAESIGGGLWFCPTGERCSPSPTAPAVFDNRAGGAGDDFVSLQSGTYSVTLANRLLGGGRVSWHADGGVQGGDIGAYLDAIGKPTEDLVLTRPIRASQ